MPSDRNALRSFVFFSFRDLVSFSIESEFLRLENIASRSEAIPVGWEAIARRLEAIPSRLEAITLFGFDWKAESKSVLHGLSIQGFRDEVMVWNAALNYPGPEHKGYLSIDDRALLLPLSKRSSGVIPVLRFLGGSSDGALRASY